MKIINKIELIIWILLTSILIYFLFPIFLTLLINTRVVSIICVLFINVIYSFICPLLLTKKYGFKWYYSLIIALLFIPFCILIYKTSTIIYFILYVLVGLVGELIYYKYVTKK